jgi:hypothetical protein
LVLPTVREVQRRFVIVPEAAVKTVAETLPTTAPMKPLVEATGPENFV